MGMIAFLFTAIIFCLFGILSLIAWENTKDKSDKIIGVILIGGIFIFFVIIMLTQV